MGAFVRSAAVAPQSAALSAAPPAPEYWRRVAALARDRVWPYLVFCAISLAFDMLRLFATVPLDDLTTASLAVANSIAASVVIWPLTFAAIVLSEALALRGWRHAVMSLSAILVATMVGHALLLWAHGGVLNRPLVEARLIVSDGAFIGRTIWFSVGGTMLLVAYFAFREREATSLRLAQAADTERTKTERATMVARLKVIQAQVEPTLLFGVLAEVRELYLRAPEDADALLDDLIAYLRAALPQMRGEASTVGREATLAVAYVKILPRAQRGDLQGVNAVDEAAQDLPFPPMVLLPLVQAATASGAKRITVEGCVRISIDPPHAVAGWSGECLATLRATVSQYLGAGATVDVTSSHATVRWPPVV